MKMTYSKEVKFLKGIKINIMIDLQKIANELDFDLEDVEMLMEVFLDSASNSLKTLKTAIESNEMEQIFSSAHSLKGSSANLTLMNISDLAGEIEHAAKEQVSINFMDKFTELKSLIDAI